MIKKIICSFVLVICLYPILFIWIGSLMGNDEVSQYFNSVFDSKESIELFILPKYVTLQAYIEILLDTPSFFAAFWNSVKTTLFILCGQLLISLPAAWWFAQSSFCGKKLLYQFYIVVMIMPFVVTMLPQYLVLKSLGLLNSHYSIILPAIFSALPVFIIYPYFQSVPEEILESSRVDGAKEWQVFLNIGIPLAIPGIWISIILNLIEYWGAVEAIIAFVEEPKLWTLPMFLNSIQMNKPSVSFVAAAISMIPPILIMMLGGRHLEEGLLNQIEEK